MHLKILITFSHDWYVQVRRGSGVYLALRDEGACATVLRVRVYYVVCEATTANLAMFPLTVAGPEVTSVVQVCQPSFSSTWFDHSNSPR